MSHPLLCQGPPHPPPCHFLPSWGCLVPIRPRGSTLPDAQRGPFCHWEHRGSGLSPWKAGPQRPWPRRRNVWLGSSPMSMALVLGIQRAARKRSLRGGARRPSLGCTPWSLLSGQPSLAPLCLAEPWHSTAARFHFMCGAGHGAWLSLECCRRPGCTPGPTQLCREHVPSCSSSAGRILAISHSAHSCLHAQSLLCQVPDVQSHALGQREVTSSVCHLLVP